jgi:putative ABC transport system ATP-binding protein
MTVTSSVELRGVSRAFEHGRIRALNGISLSIPKGAFVAITGPSGSGKTTLLNVIGGLDGPDAGEILVEGTPLGPLRTLDDYRARRVGFVFQLFNLLPRLTASENVEVGLLPQGLGAEERRARTRESLAAVGLAARADDVVTAFSGGERQRVGIARAIAGGATLLLADEPTGALDRATGLAIVDLLDRIRRERGATLLVVTHNPEVAARAEREIRLVDGRLADPAAPASSSSAPSP